MKTLKESFLENDLDMDTIKAKGYKWGIIYNFNKVEVGTIEDLEIDKALLLQARLFDDNKEVNILRDGLKFNLYYFEEDKDEFIEDSHLIIESKFNNYKQIKFKKYISYDEDGQAFISYVRPYELTY